MTQAAPARQPGVDRTELDRVVIRFAGDSGDGMQLTGDRFTSVTAAFGNDLATLPDFPAEITLHRVDHSDRLGERVGVTDEAKAERDLASE